MSSRWRLLVSIVVIATAIYVAATERPNLGLDLKGGVQITLDLKPRPGQQLSSSAANQTVEILRKRVDALGVAEPSLEVASNKRIIVSLPGLKDPKQAVDTIGQTAQLTVHPVLGAVQQQTTPTTATGSATNAPAPTPPASPATTAPASPSTTSAGLGATRENSQTVLGQEATSTTTATTAPPAETTATTTAPTPASGSNTTNPASPQQQDQAGAITAVDDSGNAYSLGPAIVKGDGIDTAAANPPDQQHTEWYLTVKFKGSAAKAWTKLTGEEACKAASDVTRQSAFVLDGRIIQMSGPASTVQCNVGITGDTTEISGGFTRSQVQQLSLLIRGGALPVDVVLASQQTVGPELGKEAIRSSELAVLIGGIVTILYILFYYRGLGLMAAFALAAYGVISFSILTLLGLTLTLPGIAGFVLAVAMAMDSNVLVYERIKEEFAAGRTMRQAANLGYKNAFTAIRDSNSTTFLAAATLYFLAIGEVKGFGVTLLIGTAVSIFVTLVILRTLTGGLLTLGWAAKRPRFLGMFVGARFRKRMAENPPDLMKASKWFMLVSVGLTIFALVGIGVRHINYGIEFAGGRLIEYQTKTPVNVDVARDEVGKLGFQQAVVQRADKDNTSVRVKSVSPDQEAKLDDVFKRLGGGEASRAQDTNIGPSFGKELKRKAVFGLIIGVGLQLIYVAYRFRWTFGIGAVVAMVHDALIVLGLFTWLHKPFDAVFLAALLTIIAFSVNDTVVVFDRIREQRRRRSSEDFAHVVSDACAQTFPRTTNISLSALFILAALHFIGGETLSDFALALMAGVVVGIYSSVFIASPIAVLLERWKPSMSRGMSSSSSAAARRAAKMSATATVQSETSDANSDVDADGNPITVKTKPTGSRPAPRPRKKGKKRR